MNHSQLLNPVAAAIPPSGIRKFFDILDEMEDVISLTVGEPDFVTPWGIRAASIRSLEHGHTHYTSNIGLLELRKQIAAYQSRRFGLSYDPEHELLVTVGGSEAIDLAFRALLRSGDQVVVHEPSFVCYGPLARLAGAEPVVVETKAADEFRLTPEALEQALTPRTKAVVLSFPNNPTGAVMEREHLEAIADILRERDIYVVSDEIYEEMNYTGRRHVSIASLPGMRERTLVVSGFSKAFAMTGWRLGYIMAPPEVTEVMKKIHQYALMCSPTASQYGAIEALHSCEQDMLSMVREYDRRRRLILKGLRDLGLPCFEARGAFYVFPDISRFGLSSEDFCSDLLRKQRVAMVPGTAFGAGGEGFVRVSYAYSIKNITEALRRLEQYIKSRA
ncbi:MAG: aminotransferase class I/II-fold pyridoxal phosphate-dependent enzyme [Firmicutes bacterium]|nr:aminotransferase class I/II-fold pyridoxal phosphate-dependent enzyme [Bacillota bacterium]